MTYVFRISHNIISNLILLLFFLFALPIISSSQVKFGITSGINFPYQRYEFNQYADHTERFKMITRFHGGIICEIPLTSKTRIQTALQVSGKGSTNSYSINGTIYQKKQTLTFLETQGIVQYLLTKKLFVGTGPVIGYAIQGKVSYNAFPDEAPLGDSQKHFDAGILFQTGYNLRQFQFSLEYNLGLLNQFFSDPDILILKNRVMSISIGYFLNKK